MATNTAEMQTEVRKLYGYILMQCNILYTDHPIDLVVRTTRDPKYFIVELNGNSLLFGYELSVPDPYLRVTILKTRLNAEVNFIEQWGEVVTRNIDHVVFLSQEYVFSQLSATNAGWTEAPAHTKFSTSLQLVKDWIEKFLTEALANPVK